MQSPTQADPSRLTSTVMPPHVCIVGGSFGGLYTALYLDQRCRRANQECLITLLDPGDRFTFTPLLYEVLTDEVKPWEIAPTYASLLHHTRIQHRAIAADSVDLHHRRVKLESGETLAYDYLVMATGSRDRPLPLPGWGDYTLRFRTYPDAERLSQRLADLTLQGIDPIHVAIVGGGPSGVELACKLADILGRRGHITLLERGDRILKPYTDRMRRAASRSLARRKVHLRLQTEVSAVEPDQIWVQSETGRESLPAHIVLGVAGTKVRPWLGETDAVDFTAGGTVRVRSTLQVPRYPEVFVVGDQAEMPWQPDQPAPSTAQAAYQSASTAAKNLLALMQQRSPKSFRYTHLGDMMTLGYRDALLATAGLVIHGKIAGFIRQAAYTYRLPPGGHHRWRVVHFRLGRIWHGLWHRPS